MTTKIKQCVGCGYCCIKTPCQAALRIYGNGIELCPALKWDENLKRHICDLMMINGVIGDEYKKELYAGAGCCCGLNNWRQDVRDRTKVQKKKTGPVIGKYFQIFLHCLGREFMSGDSIVLTVSRFESELIKGGLDKHEAEFIAKQAIYHITEERSNFQKGFMG